MMVLASSSPLDGAAGLLCLFLLGAAAGLFWTRRKRITALVSKIPGPVQHTIYRNLAGLWKLHWLDPALAHVLLFQLLCGLTQLYERERIFRIWLSFRPVVVLFKPESVEAVLSSPTLIDKSSDYTLLQPWLKTGLLTSTGTKWKARRKLLTPTFHFRILEDFLPIFNDQAKVLVDRLNCIDDGDDVDILPAVAMCTLDIICESAMGVRINAQLGGESEYVKAIYGVGEAFLTRTVRPWLWPDLVYYLSAEGRRFRKHVTVLHNFTRKVIENKKRELQTGVVKPDLDRKVKRRAFLDLLLHHHLTDGSLTAEDMCEEVDTFMFEGHDTTSVGISWALYNIGLHSDVQEKVVRELDDIFGEDTDRPVTTDDLKRMKYLECVLKESQRLFPSVPNIGRELAEDTFTNGYTIPKGTSCYLLTYMLHRDPQTFPNPERFDPDRFLEERAAGRHPYSYIPFSAGPRNCIGQKFAMMEEKTVVSTVLRHFRMRSVQTRDKVMLLPQIILRPRSGIRMVIRTRNPSDQT